jgi:hypothetical protein
MRGSNGAAHTKLGALTMNYRIAIDVVITSALSVASAITATSTPASELPHAPHARAFASFSTFSAEQFNHAQRAGQASAADERKATEFVQSQIDQHWIKVADGWTTKFQRKNAVGDVLPGEPALLYRQLRELEFTLEPHAVADDDDDGVDYRAAVKFDKTNERFYRRIESDEGPKGWSAWQDAGLSSLITVERRNGRWILNAEDLVQGVRPNPSQVPMD